MLASLAAGSADALDDPLTSPSFSRHAPDSRSYRGTETSQLASDAGRGARADRPPAAPGNGRASGGYGNGRTSGGYGNGRASHGYGNGAHANGAHANGAHANGAHGNGAPDDRTPANGMYPVSGYADQDHARTPAAPPARSAGAPRPAEYHSAPTHVPAHAQSTSPRSTTAQSTPPQGNPYGSYVEPAPGARYPAAPGYPATPSYPTRPPLGYQDQPGADFPAYPGERGHQRPAYDPAASLPYSGPAASGAARLPGHPSGADQLSPPGAYREAGYPEDGGYPGQAPYPDSRAAAGYPPGYSTAADQYRHDGYGGHPLGEG
jgi:hypothetical protein